jgi:serine phosphatase RsbU (regulator of sigma subunit)
LYREAAEKARLERELLIAAEIQRSLLRNRCIRARISAWLPRRFHAGRSAEISSTTSICLQGSWASPLGDVAGKGPPAALLTAMIQGAFASQVATVGSPAS